VDNVQFIMDKYVIERARVEVVDTSQASATFSSTDSLSLPVASVLSAFVGLQTVRPQKQQTMTSTL